MHRRARTHLVTGAAVSRADEQRHRQRRYLLTMAARLVLLIVAAIMARYNMPLGISIGVLSAVLPWFAVVMANDRPPKSSKRFRAADPGPAERALPSARSDSDRRVITADFVVIDENGATFRSKEK